MRGGLRAGGARGVPWWDGHWACLCWTVAFGVSALGIGVGGILCLLLIARLTLDARFLVLLPPSTVQSLENLFSGSIPTQGVAPHPLKHPSRK